MIITKYEHIITFSVVVVVVVVVVIVLVVVVVVVVYHLFGTTYRSLVR